MRPHYEGVALSQVEIRPETTTRRSHAAAPATAGNPRIPGDSTNGCTASWHGLEPSLPVTWGPGHWRGPAWWGPRENPEGHPEAWICRPEQKMAWTVPRWPWFHSGRSECSGRSTSRSPWTWGLFPSVCDVAVAVLLFVPPPLLDTRTPRCRLRQSSEESRDGVAVMRSLGAEAGEDGVGTLGQRPDTARVSSPLVQRARQRPPGQALIERIDRVVAEQPQGVLERRDRGTELSLSGQDLPAHGEEPCLVRAF